LREKENQKTQDIKEICYICGLSREIFDRKSDSGFKTHIKRDHYLWNYLFYLAYLDDKEPTEYTGIETYISKKREG
jgi:inositol 1,4,5-triphosphate receptor type 1/inositol 1,4,5-triphosphate receptor type 3